MTDIQNIQVIILKIVQLLRLGGFEDWAGALEKHHDDIASEPNITKGRILSLYGGMGSLNDLVLYNKGDLLAKENSELDVLRSQLYELCHASVRNYD